MLENQQKNSAVEEDRYQSTIKESKEESIKEAISILLEEIREHEQEQLKMLERPNVSVKKGIFGIIFFLSAFTLCFLLSEKLSIAMNLSITTIRLVFLIVFIVVGLIFLKKLIIWSIMVYQKFAPAKIRLSCCFEPSCSEYMKLAVEKYGVIRGVIKGLRRLLRCHYPNGGIDYP